MKAYFEGSEYHTPEDLPLYRREKWLLGNRKGFFRDYLGRVAWIAKEIKKGRYTYDKYAWTSISIFRDCEKHGAKMHIYGLDHLRSLDGPCVIASNHMSTMETQVLTSMFYPAKAAFVVKDSLLKQPFFRYVLSAIYNVPVSRKNPIEDMKKVLEKGKDLLDQNVSVIIFPEGTRKKYFSPKEFNSLAVKLAASAGVPLVPLAVRTDFWGQDKILKDFGKISRDIPVNFCFGEPEVPEGRGKKTHQKCLKFIEEKLREWDFPVQN